MDSSSFVGPVHRSFNSTIVGGSLEIDRLFNLLKLLHMSIVQLGPSLKVNPKTWFGPKHNTKLSKPKLNQQLNSTEFEI